MLKSGGSAGTQGRMICKMSGKNCRNTATKSERWRALTSHWRDASPLPGQTLSVMKVSAIICLGAALASAVLVRHYRHHEETEQRQQVEVAA